MNKKFEIFIAQCLSLFFFDKLMSELLTSTGSFTSQKNYWLFYKLKLAYTY